MINELELRKKVLKQWLNEVIEKKNKIEPNKYFSLMRMPLVATQNSIEKELSDIELKLKNFDEPGQFYCMTKTGKTPPKFVHGSYLSAKKEAERLCLALREEVKILRVIDSVELINTERLFFQSEFPF